MSTETDAETSSALNKSDQSGPLVTSEPTPTSGGVQEQQIPVDAIDARLKEEIITQFYFGYSHIGAQDFINANLDLILMGKLDDPEVTYEAAQQLVADYLAAYCHWAAYASFHRSKHNSAVSQFSFWPFFN